jgi:hypothetical protein
MSPTTVTGCSLHSTAGSSMQVVFTNSAAHSCSSAGSVIPVVFNTQKPRSVPVSAACPPKPCEKHGRG